MCESQLEDFPGFLPWIQVTWTPEAFTFTTGAPTRPRQRRPLLRNPGSLVPSIAYVEYECRPPPPLRHAPGERPDGPGPPGLAAEKQLNPNPRFP